MRLSRLSSENVTELVSNTIGVSSLPAEVIDVLLEKAGGHPLFSQDVARHWKKTGALHVSNGVCKLNIGPESLHEGRNPETIHSAIIGRYERLLPTYQLVLKVASVIGRRFDFKTLKRLYPIHIEFGELMSALQTLIDWGFIEQEDTGDYRFSYGLLQEVALSLLLYSQRRELGKMI